MLAFSFFVIALHFFVVEALLFRRSEQAKAFFTPTSTLGKARTRIECATFLHASLLAKKRTPFAFQWTKSTNSCHHGTLGMNPGDLDDIPEENINVTESPTGVYYPINCLTKTSDFGEDLEFFFSWFDDNAKNEALIKNQVTNKFERVPVNAFRKLAAVNMVYNTYDGWKDPLAVGILDSIPFATPRSSFYPAFFTYATSNSLMFLAEPRTISSFSIFAWSYFRVGTHFDGNLWFGSQPATYSIVFQNGWHGETGRGELFLGSATLKYTCSVLWTQNKWIFIGVTFNATNREIRFYENGIQKGNTMVAATSLANKVWTDQKYIKVGESTENSASWVAWSPRAWVEFYGVWVAPSEAYHLYELALDRFVDKCG